MIEPLDRSPVWGEQLSLTLLAYLPELGTLNRKQIAALVGVWFGAAGCEQFSTWEPWSPAGATQ